MYQIMTFTFAIILGVCWCVGSAGAEEKKEEQVILMLGGKFCEFYTEDVEKTLKEIEGVTSVDLKSMKGHAIVTGGVGKLKAEQLTAAVNEVKGKGWHCKAEVMQ